MSLRLVAKRTAQFIAATLVFPSALLSAFGRLRPVYTFFAHLYALGPGLPGSYVRSAYYYFTLQNSSIDTTIAPGTIFAHPGASIGPGVSIGCYCVVGLASIGEWTQISSHVEIPSGRNQHQRDASGNLVDSIDEGVRIGARCWIGASAVVLADIGDHTTIGAGAVVVKSIPPQSVAVGNPAKVIRTLSASQI